MNDQEYNEKVLCLAYLSFEEIARLSKEERREAEWIFQQEVRYCSRFTRFLKWVKIIEPPIPGQTGGGVIPLFLFPHILQIVAVLLKEKLISVLKARQIGLSTIIAAYVVWYALTHVGANILLFSKGQPEAKELLAKCRRIYDQLPRFLRLKLDPDSTEAIGFASQGSTIIAFPSTTGAGISYTASIVVCDEHAAHPYADENYIATKPTRDKGGQFISVFTADPYSNDNLGTAIFIDALEEKNDFKPLFFPWNVMPDRDQEWYDRTKRNIPDRELSGLSPELYMVKNYPSSIEEALSAAKDVVVFDKKVLTVMKEDIRGHINEGTEERWGGIDHSICHIYRDYHIGNFYIAGSDVALGVQGDNHVTCILDVQTGDIVADILRNDITPEEFAAQSVELLKHYHNPLWWIEANLYGRTVIKKAVELGYRRLGYRGDKPIYWAHLSDDDLKRIGFFTDDKHRADLFGALIPAINDYQIKIYNENGLRQFSSMIRNANKQGKIEAASGQHDDYVIAVGICWLKKGDVVTGTETTKPIQSLHFDGGETNKVLARWMGNKK